MDEIIEKRKVQSITDKYFKTRDSKLLLSLDLVVQQEILSNVSKRDIDEKIRNLAKEYIKNPSSIINLDDETKGKIIAKAKYIKDRDEIKKNVKNRLEFKYFEDEEDDKCYLSGYVAATFVKNSNLIVDLKNKRDTFAGIGTNKTKRRLNKLVLNPIAKAFRIALEAEDKSISAKDLIQRTLL